MRSVKEDCRDAGPSKSCDLPPVGPVLENKALPSHSHDDVLRVLLFDINTTEETGDTGTENHSRLERSSTFKRQDGYVT
jgi:hypothetical protein